MNFIELKNKFKKENYTCLIYYKDEFYSSTLRGVKPLVEFINKYQTFEDSLACDKVVGKATAFLYIILKIKKLYCHVISEKALDILNKYNIEVEYDLLVKNIINRNKDGICPFELEVLNIDNPNEAYVKIINKLKDFI